MPQQPVQGPDGNLYQFPEGTTKEQAIAFFKKKGIGAKKSDSNTDPQNSYWLDPVLNKFGTSEEKLTEIQKPDPEHPLHPREAAKAVGNIGAGGMGVMFHPINTLESMGELFSAGMRNIGNPAGLAAEPVVRSMVQSFVDNPYGATESAVGQAAVMDAAGEAGGPMARALKNKVQNVREGTLRFTSRTGPSLTRKVVEDTKTANETAATKAAEKNADLEANRKAELKKHFDATQKVREQNAAKQAELDRKTALERGVEHLDPELKTSLEHTEKDIHEKANQNYQDIRNQIGDKVAEPYQAVGEDGHIVGEPVPLLQHIYDDAAAKISDWSKDPALLKSVGERLEGVTDPVRGQDVNVTWADLQDLRAKVGAELRKGTLPPDQYLAYKSMMKNIDEAMQKIADSNGLGKAQSAARDYYRRFAETFWDRSSPIRKALDSTERGGVVRALRGKDISGIEQLAQFNPDLAKRINTVRGYASEASGIRTSSTPPKAEPTLSPKKPPVQAEKTVLTPEKLTEAKRARSVQRANAIRNSSEHLATVFVVLDTVQAAMRGEPLPLIRDITGRAAYTIGKYKLANYLESPKVLDAVGKITAKDVEEVMKLSEDQRAGFDQLILEAQTKGAKLKPGVLGAVFGMSTPSMQGKKTRELKRLRDQGAYTDRSDSQ